MVATMPTATELSGLLERLQGAVPAADDRERVDLLTVLEAIKSGAAAAQARVTVELDAARRAEEAGRGVPAKEQGRGVASEVALARKDSPVKGARHLGLAKALVREMPHTLRALATGEISEWRATVMVRETATLSAEHRGRVDERLAGRLGGLGDRGVEREAKKLAYQLDPHSAVRRARRATSERRVTIRPAPDTMSYVTGLLPVAQGVAVCAALTRHADALRASGDSRTRGQIMADTLVERVTGQEQASEVPVEVHLVMTDRSLLAGAQTPAHLLGHGPIPAEIGRLLVLGSSGAPRKAKAWIRRLYTSPVTGDLVAMDSRRRLFPELLKRFLVVRDGTCRMPWCDAPVRHGDHVKSAAGGGPTSARNGQGLCETCNYVKESAGWSSSVSRAGPGTPVTVVTPSGHRYRSVAPDPPGERPALAAVRAAGGTRDSPLEEQLERLLSGASSPAA